MRRTLLALAIAGLSVAADAAPPPGGGPPGPIDVNVTNPVLPVEVSNADPIPVTVTAQPASMFYYYQQAASCPFGNQCVAQFPAVPAGKRLVITNIRLVAISQQAGDGIFAIRPNDAVVPLVMYPLTSFSGAYHSTSFSANHEVEVMFGPGSIPTLEFGRAAGNDIYANGVFFGVTGYLTDLSP